MKSSSFMVVILLIASMLVESSRSVEPEQVPSAAKEIESFKITSPKKITRSTLDWDAEASKWWVANVQKALQEHDAEHQEIRKTLDAETVRPLAEEVRVANQDKGFVIFNRSYKDFVLAREAPTAEETKVKQLKISLAGEEWEPVQIGVWPLKDAKNFSCKVTSLKQKGGQHEIGGKHVRVLYGFNLLYPEMEKVAGRADGDVTVDAPKKKMVGWKEEPLALLDLPSVGLKQGRAQAVLIDVYASPETPDGEYEGEIGFSIEGVEVAKLPLVVEVYPFVLDWVQEWARGAFISRMRNRDELIQMREHGMNMVSWWSGGYKLKLRDGKVVADFKVYQDYLKLLDETGFDGPHTVFLGASDPKITNKILELLNRPTISNGRDKKNGEAFEKADLSPPFSEYLCQTLRQFHQQMKECGHGDTLAVILDEPDHEPRPQRRNFYLKVYDMVEKGVPELPTYGVFYHKGDEDRLSHHHTVWCSNRPAAKIATMSKKAGKQLWTYGFGFGFNTRPGDRRFNFGFSPWVFGASGSFFWGNYWAGSELWDPWKIEDRSTVGLATPSGPLATPALKAVRENIDDGRYVRMLEKLISHAKKSSDPTLQEEAKVHQQFLESFQKPMFEKMTVLGGRHNFGSVAGIEIVGLDGTKITLEEKTDPFVLSEFLRRDIAKRIVRLRAKM
jgi:hypothetical protein